MSCLEFFGRRNHVRCSTRNVTIDCQAPALAHVRPSVCSTSVRVRRSDDRRPHDMSGVGKARITIPLSVAATAPGARDQLRRTAGHHALGGGAEEDPGGIDQVCRSAYRMS
jgi:hypothetical protein